MDQALLSVAFAALASAAVPAGPDWWWVDSSPRQRSMVERSGIVRTGPYATAWLQTFFVLPMSANQFSARYLVRYDCVNGEATVLSGRAYDGDGRSMTAPVPDAARSVRGTFQTICDADWRAAKQVRDLEDEVRMWRVANGR